MLVAAGMDAQEMEAKLVGDVDKAEAALVKEKDPANKAERRLMWEKAEERLHSFRMQQVAGGGDPSQAATFDLHDVRQQGVRLAGGSVQGPATRAGGGLELGHAGHLRACSVHPTRAAPLGCRVSSHFSQTHSKSAFTMLDSACWPGNLFFIPHVLLSLA